MTTSSLARVAALAAAFTAAGVGVAHAQDERVPAIEQVGGAAPRPQPWQLSLGVRSALFRSAGYDPFSTDDVFAQGALTATRAFRTGARLAMAAGVLWESGSQDATARGANFEEANVFRADAAKMKGDDQTSFKGANVKQVRMEAMRPRLK